MKLNSWARSVSLVLVFAGQMATADFPLHISTAENKDDVLKSAVYDADKGVITVEIDSDNACNYSEARLRRGISGRSSSRSVNGPFNYSLIIGTSTTMKCGERSTAKLEIPFDKQQARGHIHLSKGSSSIKVAGVPEIKKNLSKRPIIHLDAKPVLSANEKPLIQEGRE